MTTRRTYSLLDLDEDLGQLLPDARRVLAHAQLQVEVHRLAAGPLKATMADTNPEHVGLLLLEGVVSREVVVSDTVSTELLGPGDVVRPWAVHGETPMLQLEIRWNALTESRVAVLDRRFAGRLTQWPEVNSVLIDRLNARAQRLAVTQAISQLNRVDRRILALFWHLADRWGRVTPDGVLVPLTLSHRMLGQLVGARRPTVSTAVAKLAEHGDLIRRDNGTWIVKGEPVGLPAGEAQRVVPIRRRLIGQEHEVEPDADGGVALAEEQHAPEQLVTRLSGAELRATLARLRSDSIQHLEDLRAVTTKSGEMVRISKEGARLRAEQREARRRRAGTLPKPR
jgi:CRP/FNR family transcriptional regulator, cyclic AMP receptor protein